MKNWSFFYTFILLESDQQTTYAHCTLYIITYNNILTINLLNNYERYQRWLFTPWYWTTKLRRILSFNVNWLNEPRRVLCVCVCVNALSWSKFYNLQVSSVPGDYVWSDLDSWCTYFIPISHTFSLCLHLLFWSFYLLFMQFFSLSSYSLSSSSLSSSSLSSLSNPLLFLSINL